MASSSSWAWLEVPALYAPSGAPRGQGATPFGAHPGCTRRGKGGATVLRPYDHPVAGARPKVERGVENNLAPNPLRDAKRGGH